MKQREQKEKREADRKAKLAKKVIIFQAIY